MSSGLPWFRARLSNCADWLQSNSTAKCQCSFTPLLIRSSSERGR